LSAPVGTLEIRAIEVSPLSVPTVDPFRIASGEVHATRSILVRARVARGDRQATGLGEGACLPPVTIEDQADALAAIRAAAPRLAGSALSGEADLAAVLDDLLGATPVARSAIEVAVLDGLSTLDGLPLWRWLSGERTAAPPRIETDVTLPILAPAESARLAAHWWALGFRHFKIKIGRRLDDDLAALDAIAGAVPGARLRIDANAGLTVDEVLRYAEATAAHGLAVDCYEQPCATLDELAAVASRVTAPVIADESLRTPGDLDAVLQRRSVSGVNLKIAKIGSLLRSLAIGRAARAQGLVLMVGGMVETRLGMTAASHLVAALGGVELADLDTAWLLATDPFVGGYRETRESAPEERGPVYVLDESAGLGVRLRPETAA
jgi:L-Ala-D/L-Glu epimerase